ncbi:class I SAM-dependent methyltransferase [Methylobacterium terricola]|uniref:Class I SAM-dependent methyltransferase n=1 Tax=Methylobacterium terricola TaxID=2583531 RepID=A0A5C4LE89_9HYPH|nr:class I SAM-dependent methyltransferase [Methylobacterium terricola]TNC10866.1 class I SAM-dependent methyltransferase [Methylobacterium terricola]
METTHGSQNRAISLAGKSPQRAEDDFYPTPDSATLALLARESFPGIVWEPACGDGAMARHLDALPGVEAVIATDLVDRGYGAGGIDFLQTREVVDHVVTNPPFSLAEPFIRHALACSTGKVAMLLKLQFLEGVRREKLFSETPLARVYVFRRRLAFSRNGEPVPRKGMIAFAWFVWEHGYQGDPVLKWV